MRCYECFCLKMMLFFFFFSVQAMAQQSQKEYYLINIKNMPSGYILMETSHSTDGEGKIVCTRHVTTALKTELGSKMYDYKILEKSTFSPDLVSYSVEKSANNRILGLQKYFFLGNKATLNFYKNAQENIKETIELPMHEALVGDSFSLLPLLKKGKDFPVTLSIVDIKTILPPSAISLQKLSIQPKGKESLVIEGKNKAALLFSVPWEKNILKIWTTEDVEKILQIQDDNGQMKVVLSNLAEIQAIEQLPQQSLLSKIRDFPFDIGINHEYVFSYENQKIGSLQFVCSWDNAREKYVIKAKTNIVHKGNEYKAESETQYNSSLQPQFYQIKDNKEIEIVCEFLTQGVKESLKKDGNAIEYLLMLPPDFILADNNAIHHFALLIPLCPLETGREISFSIFHPRRMRCSEANLKIQKKTQKYILLELTTPYHKANLWVTPKGKLVRYVQDKLEIVLVSGKN